MEIEFDNSHVKALKFAYDCCDQDNDGVLSVEDLQKSSGLNCQEAEALFKQLKTQLTSPYLSFAEFKKGIMYFPELLQQLESEYFMNQERGEIWTIQSEDSEQVLVSPGRDSENDLVLDTVLYELRYLYSPETIVNLQQKNYQENIDEITFILRQLSKKYSHPAVSKLCNICLLYSGYLVRQTEKSEQNQEYLNIKLQQSEIQLQAAERSLRHLQEQNQILTQNLSMIENESAQVSIAHTEAVQEKRQLQAILVKKENLSQVQDKMQKIQSLLSDKEFQREKLQQELKKLSSMKTLHQLSQYTLSQDDKRRLKISIATPKYEPSVFFSGKINRMSSGRPSYHYPNVSILNIQIQSLKNEKTVLQKQNKRLKKKIALQEESMSQKEFIYNQKIQNLNFQLKELLIKNQKVMMKKNSFKNIETEEQEKQQSLYDELNMLESQGFTEQERFVQQIQKEIIQRFSVRIPQEKKKRRWRWCGF